MAQTLQYLKQKGYWVVGADMDNARDYREGDYQVPLVLVIGSEGFGLRPLVKKQCDYLIRLPMCGKVNSLNAQWHARCCCIRFMNSVAPFDHSPRWREYEGIRAL